MGLSYFCFIFPMNWFILTKQVSPSKCLCPKGDKYDLTHEVNWIPSSMVSKEKRHRIWVVRRKPWTLNSPNGIIGTSTCNKAVLSPFPVLSPSSLFLFQETLWFFFFPLVSLNLLINHSFTAESRGIIFILAKFVAASLFLLDHNWYYVDCRVLLDKLRGQKFSIHSKPSTKMNLFMKMNQVVVRLFHN